MYYHYYLFINGKNTTDNAEYVEYCHKLGEIVIGIFGEICSSLAQNQKKTWGVRNLENALNLG